MTMFAGITWLAITTKVKVAESTEDLIGMPPGTEQKTVIAQVAQAVFSNFTPMFSRRPSWRVSNTTSKPICRSTGRAFSDSTLGGCASKSITLGNTLKRMSAPAASSGSMVTLNSSARFE